MAVFNEPKKWAQTLGKDADVVKIPDIAGDTDPSIDKIFPAVFSIPLAHGGKAIPRSVLNGLFKLLGDWSFYQQNGGIASYSNTFDYAVGSFVKYNNELYLCIQANGASSTVKAPTDAKYWLRVALNNDLANYLPLAGGNITGNLTVQNKNVVRSVNGVNADKNGNVQLGNLGVITGKIEWFAFNTAPDGYLVCNGASVSRTTYANLFAVIGTNFGSGNGSTTFNLPDLRDRYIIGANTHALGTRIAEQLPNIIARANDLAFGENRYAVGGALSATIVSQLYYQTIESSKTRLNFVDATINAHNFNSVYTDDGHVYPLSLALLPCIKY